MPEKFRTAINEIKDAKEIIPALIRRVYTSSEGAAVRTLLYDMGVRNLVWVYNEIAKFRAPIAVLDETHYEVVSFPSMADQLKAQMERLDLVVAWLDDPYLFDDRKELREAAYVGLDKAMIVLKSVIEFVSNPR